MCSSYCTVRSIRPHPAHPVLVPILQSQTSTVQQAGQQSIGMLNGAVPNQVPGTKCVCFFTKPFLPLAWFVNKTRVNIIIVLLTNGYYGSTANKCIQPDLVCTAVYIRYRYDMLLLIVGFLAEGCTNMSMHNIPIFARDSMHRYACLACVWCRSAETYIMRPASDSIPVASYWYCCCPRLCIATRSYCCINTLDVAVVSLATR